VLACRLDSLQVGMSAFLPIMQVQHLQHFGSLCPQDVFSADTRSLVVAVGLSGVCTLTVQLRKREPLDPV